MFIGLTPSTADEPSDAPTLTRYINYAKPWGFGGVCMANLFAFRATSPSDMTASIDPIGKKNNRWLEKLAYDDAIVVAASGKDGSYLKGSEQVKAVQLNLQECVKLENVAETLVIKIETAANPYFQKVTAYFWKRRNRKESKILPALSVRQHRAILV